MMKEWRHLSYKGTLRPGTVQTREEGMSTYSMEKDERARLFSVVSSGRTRGNYHKWKHKKLYPIIGKDVFTGKVFEERNNAGTLHREVVESPAMGIFKT